MKTKSKRTGGQILGIVFYLSGEDPRCGILILNLSVQR